MDAETKKRVKIAGAVVCLVLAAAITYSNHPYHHRSALDDIPKDEMIWVKCANKECGAEYQMSLRDYWTYVREHSDPFDDDAPEPALICEKCGKPSLFRAMKCEKCGEVFFQRNDPKDWADRCPACGYSKVEALRKEGRQDN